MHSQRTRSSGAARLLWLVISCSLLIILLSGCDLGADSGVTASTPTTTTGDSVTQVAQTTDPTPEATRRAVSTVAATTTPVPFQVTGVAASVDISHYSGVCSSSKTFTITGIIYAPANNSGGTVSYTWERSDKSAVASHSVTFAANVTAVTVKYTWSLGASLGNGTTQYWVALQTLAPQTMISSRAVFSFKCQRTVKSIVASVTPAQGCMSVLGTYTFSAVITVTPGPGSLSVQYSWKRSDGASSQSATVTVAQGATSVTVSESSWQLTPTSSGTIWEEVVVSSPGSFTSNKATVTIKPTCA